MATITLKQVPESLHRRLKERAERNRRSLNAEAILCIESVVMGGPARGGRLDVDSFLAEVRETRTELQEKGIWITDESIAEAIDEGRR